MKAKDDLSKVRDMDLFNDVCRGLLALNRRHDELRLVALDRRVEDKYGLGFVDADRRRFRALRVEGDRFEAAIAAMRFGRDVTSDEAFEADVLGCFDKKGRHERETIVRRYFGFKRGNLPPTMAMDEWVGRKIAALVEAKRIAVGYHKRTHHEIYLLVTPERQAVWKKAREENTARQDARKAAKARQAAVIAALKACRCDSAKVPDHGSRRITMTVEDAEKLIVMLTVGAMAVNEAI